MIKKISRLFAPSGRLLRVAALTAFIPAAPAAVFQWNTLGPISSTWSTTGNWQGGLAPSSSNNTDTVRFFANNYGVLMPGNVTANMNLTAPRVLNKLILSGRGGSAYYTVTLNGGALQLTGANPELVLEANAGTAALAYDVYNAIQIPGATAITSPGYGIVNLRGPFSGTGSLTIDAVKPQLTLYSTSTYTGATTISGGTVYIATNNALPTTTALTLAAGATLDLNSRWSGAAGGNQTVASLSGAGTVTNNNNSVTRTLTINGSGNSTFFGSLTSGSGGTPNKSRLNVVKSGDGTLTLTGTSDYTGTTTVNAGTLVVNGSLASPVILSGTGRLGGGGTLGGGLTLGGASRLSVVVTDAAGSAGSGWNRTTLGGALAITATAANPVVIDLASAGTGGKADNFIPGRSYEWTVLTATGGITGFTADRFAINTAGFANAFVEQNLPHGAFSIEQNGNDLRVVYLPAAIPNLAIYKGGWADKSPVPFEQWLGRPINRMYDGIAHATDVAGSWTSWHDRGNFVTTHQVYSWVASGSRYRANHNIAMLPSDLGTGSTTMAVGATGAYNAHWATLAQKLISNGQGSAIIRIGWEMNYPNGPWEHWKWQVANSTQSAHFINYWRHIVTTMRGVAGANFLFDFCAGRGWSAYDAINNYPGDAYVDIIGLDLYNVTAKATKRGPVEAWDEVWGNDTSYGLKYWHNFAMARGKFFSLPEWGTGVSPDDPAKTVSGNGDDPYFIRKVYQFVTNPANKVLYHTYWDYPARDFNATLSNNQYPLAGAMFRELFGQEEYWDADVGTTPIPGDTSYDAATKVHTIRGTGAGLGGTADAFHFEFTPKMGDTSIIARVTGIQNTSANAVLGVMIREDMTPGSRFVFAGITQGGVARFQHRATVNAATSTPYTASSVSLPQWFKITRVGNVFTAYRSATGGTWTNIGSQTIAMNANTYIGLALAGLSATQRNVATVDNVNESYEVIVDNADPIGVTFTGTWNTYTGTSGGPPWAGSIRSNATPGVGSATYTPVIPETGTYTVYMWFTHGDNRPVNAPFTVVHAGGTSNITASQRYKESEWRLIGTFNFNAGTGGSVTFNTAGATTYQGTSCGVIADALRFVKIR
jgi:autotransporter-associated beta strand protein